MVYIHETEVLATKKKSKKLWIVVLIFAVVCLSGCIAYFIYMSDELNQLKKLQSIAYDLPVYEQTDEPVKFANPINFKELKKQNDDIYAWINVSGTIIDYPILQHPTDNEYYLFHTSYGKWSNYGSIYTENYNSTDFNDFNTLVYGHNMFNGTMFGTLRRFRDKKFFDNNRYITVYLPDAVLKYEIFSAQVWDTKHILLNNDFSNIYGRLNYIDEIFSKRKLNANINSNITVNENDKIITLSTCAADDERYLVQGVLIYDSRENK